MQKLKFTPDQGKIARQLLLMVLLSCPIFAAGQQDSLKLKDKYFFRGGLAFGKGTGDGIYAQVHFQLQHFTNYLAIKVAGFEDFQLMMADEPIESITEFSAIFGKSLTVNRSNFQFGLGPSLLKEISKGAYISSSCKGCFLGGHDIYEKVEKRPFGISTEIKYNLYFSTWGAVSLSLNSNFNHAQSYFALAGGIVIGRLRPHLN